MFVFQVKKCIVSTFRYVIILLTGKDDLDYEKVTIDDFARGAPPYMKTILSSDLPVMAFNNRAEAKENVDQVNKLLQQVDILCATRPKSNERSFLNNAKFAAAEKLMQEAMATI